ncbi:MAG TPA: hypothetical protein VNE16_09685 [Vicinamibacterales bacterium]|nr:hypothetical protein [Vicinamibacterales bacterium]
MQWMSDAGLPFLVGLAVPVVVQRYVGWWLDSSRGVAVALVLLFALGVVFALGRPARPWRRAGALCVGAFAGSAAILFWNGPGTIWPIVLVMAAALSTFAVLAGAGVVQIGLTAIGRR